MIDTKDAFPARVSRLGAYITRASQHGKASILFAMYLSEFLRVEVENSLETSLREQGLETVRVDAGEHKDLPQYFSSHNSGKSVFLVHNLENGFPDAIQFLNFKRETLIEQKVKAIFWVREEELARITLEAPDFFAFRNRVVEFMDAPTEKEFQPALVSFVLDTECRSPEETRRNIALKEKLLSELSTETEIRGYLLSSLAVLYRKIGAYQKSMDYSEKALEIDLTIFGDKHPNVARNYNNVGTAWMRLGYLGDVKKSIEYYGKALDILLEVYGERHPDIAATYNNLGVAWNMLGDIKKAMEYYNKALEIDLAVFGDKHSNVARDYNNISFILNKLGDAKKSFEFLTKSLEICKAVYGVDHPSTKTVQDNLDLLQGNKHPKQQS